MRKAGYFFFAFVPLFIILGIQFLAVFFMYGAGALSQLLLGKNLFPSTSVIQRIIQTYLYGDFNVVVMILYALFTIAIFGMWYYSSYGGEYLPSPKKTFHPLMILSIFIAVPGAQFLSNFIVAGIYVFKPEWIEQYEMLFEAGGMSDISIFMFIYAVLLAPICEELIFRGVTLRCFEKSLPFWLANLFQAALFGAFHMNWVQGLYAFVLGIILGIVCECGGSIYYSMLMHFLFNLWGTVLAGLIPETDSAIFIVIVIAITVISLVAGISLFFVGRNLRNKKVRLAS